MCPRYVRLIFTSYKRGDSLTKMRWRKRPVAGRRIYLRAQGQDLLEELIDMQSLRSGFTQDLDNVGGLHEADAFSELPLSNRSVLA